MRDLTDRRRKKISKYLEHRMVLKFEQQQNKSSSGRSEKTFKSSNSKSTKLSSNTYSSKKNAKVSSSHNKREHRDYYDDAESSVSSAGSFHTQDTDENSESKLVDLGVIGRESDLSDYWDNKTLDTREEEEFEMFLQKHADKQQGFLSLVLSNDNDDNDDSVENLSLPSQVSRTSEESSGIVENLDEVDDPPQASCMMKVCFCVDDEGSFEGSYGGLHDDEILFAASAAKSKTWDTHELSATQERSFQETRTFETEGVATEHDDPTITDTAQSTAGVGERRHETATFSRLFCCHPTDEFKELPSHTEQENDVSDSESMLYQTCSNSREETYDSDGESEWSSVSEHEKRSRRAARRKAHEEPRDGVGIKRIISSDSVSDVGNKKVFVVGDNVDVSEVKEVRTENGEKAFVVFLKKKGPTEYNCESEETRDDLTALPRHQDSRTDVVVVSDALGIVPGMPKLVLDDALDKYLAHMYLQKEQNEQESTRPKARRLIRAHQSDTDIEMTLAKSSSVDSNTASDSLGNYVQTTQDGVQYLFCLREENFDHGVIHKSLESLDTGFGNASVEDNLDYDFAAQQRGCRNSLATAYRDARRVDSTRSSNKKDERHLSQGSRSGRSSNALMAAYRDMRHSSHLKTNQVQESLSDSTTDCFLSNPSLEAPKNLGEEEYNHIVVAEEEQTEDFSFSCHSHISGSHHIIGDPRGAELAEEDSEKLPSQAMDEILEITESSCEVSLVENTDGSGNEAGEGMSFRVENTDGSGNEAGEGMSFQLPNELDDLGLCPACSIGTKTEYRGSSLLDLVRSTSGGFGAGKDDSFDEDDSLVSQEEIGQLARENWSEESLGSECRPIDTTVMNVVEKTGSSDSDQFFDARSQISESDELSVD